MPGSPRFDVVRLNWHRHPGGWMRMAGERAVASFGSRAEAEEDAARREQAARVVVNPFLCGFVWTDRTALPEPVFADWVADHDLLSPPVADGRREWAAWWELIRERGPEFEAMVWGVLPGVRFFAVREVTPGPRAFVLLRNAAITEEPRDEVPLGRRARWTGRMRVLPEGGEPVMLSFNRSRLEEHRDSLEANRLADDQDDFLYRDERAADPFDTTPTAYVPANPSFLYEIAELELPAAPDPFAPVRVVCRAGHFIDNGEWVQCEEPTCLVPLRAFTNPGETEHRRKRANRAVHGAMDPVFFAPGWSNGSVGAANLNTLFESRGLPPLPTALRFGSKTPSTTIHELGAWWRANGDRLTSDLRPVVWELLGDYGFLCPVLEFIPDQPGCEWV